jgi:predicted amidohydrolase
MICSECRFPDVAWDLAADGAELIVVPMAYSRLVDPRFDSEKWRSLDDILDREVSRRAKETRLPIVAVAASGYYERKGKGLYRYEFEGGFALLGDDGEFVYRKLNSGVEMYRFQIIQRSEPVETVLMECRK